MEIFYLETKIYLGAKNQIEFFFDIPYKFSEKLDDDFNSKK